MYVLFQYFTIDSFWYSSENNWHLRADIDSTLIGIVSQWNLSKTTTQIEAIRYTISKNTVTTLPSSMSVSLRTCALIGKRYDQLFFSGKILVSRAIHPILAFTLTDHRPFLGIFAAISLICSETSCCTVKKYHDDFSCCDRFRTVDVLVKWWGDGVVAMEMGDILLRIASMLLWKFC